MRRVVPAVAVGAGLWTLAIWISGGPHFQLFGIRISSTDPIRPLLISVLAYAVYFRCWPDAFCAHARFVVFLPVQWPRVSAGALTAAAFCGAMAWAANVAGSADSYGYVSQAGLWREGHLIVHQDIVRQVPWPDAAWTFAPLGYRPSTAESDAIVPTYAPGLPLLMALLQLLVGYCGAYLVVPLCVGAVVWLTYALGRRLFASAGIGLWGALLLATSPTFMFQALWPMTDVPVAATWTAALLLVVAGRPLWAGLLMSATIAIRPNLLPLPLTVLAWTVLRDIRCRRADGWWRYTVPLALGLLPAIVGVAALNHYLYGSPLSSGYGNTSGLYALRNASTNAIRYSSWMIETETPAIAIALLFFVAPGLFTGNGVRFPRLLLGGTIAGTVFAYLFYYPFSDWWYLRFLLPMWPVVMLLMAAGIDAVSRRWLPRARPIIVGACVIFFAWHGTRLAIDRGVFGLGRGERRYVDVARFVAAHTDPRAVILTMQHSGSIRHYAGRLTMRYDFLNENWLDKAVEYLQSAGRHPYIVVESWEVEPFRQRFAQTNRLGALDWSPVAALDLLEPVALYDLASATAPAPTISVPPASMNRSSGWPCERPSDAPLPVR